MGPGFTIKLQRWIGNPCTGNIMTVNIQKLLDSPFCWKSDDFSLMGHEGHSVNWIASPTAINSGVYCNSLTCLHRRFQLWCQGKLAPRVLFSMTVWDCTVRTLASLRYTILPYPPYSPYLAQSDYAVFYEMKEPPQEKIPYLWWPGERCSQLCAHYSQRELCCRYPTVTREMVTVPWPWWVVWQNCFSVICHLSSVGGL